MMKKTKIMLILVLIFFIIGVGMISVGASMGGIDYVKHTNIDVLPKKSNSYSDDIKKANDNFEDYDLYSKDLYSKDLDDFSAIEIDLRNTNMQIIPSDSDVARVSFPLEAKKVYKAEVNDDKLHISGGNEGKAFISGNPIKKISINLNNIKEEILGIDSNDNIVNLYLFLPQKKYEEVLVYTSGTFTNIKNLNAKSLECELSMGELHVEDCELENLKFDNSVGISKFSDLKVLDEIDGSNSVGNIELKDCSARSYKLNQQMGNIEFSGLEVFEEFNATNQMGNIKGAIILDEKKDYLIGADASIGEIDIDDLFYKMPIKEINEMKNSEDDVKVILESDMGNISLEGDNR